MCRVNKENHFQREQTEDEKYKYFKTKSCDIKNKYTYQQIQQMKAEEVDFEEKYRIYRCSICGFLHRSSTDQLKEEKLLGNIRKREERFNASRKQPQSNTSSNIQLNTQFVQTKEVDKKSELIITEETVILTKICLSAEGKQYIRFPEEKFTLMENDSIEKLILVRGVYSQYSFTEEEHIALLMSNDIKEDLLKISKFVDSPSRNDKIIRGRFLKACRTEKRITSCFWAPYSFFRLTK